LITAIDRMQGDYEDELKDKFMKFHEMI